MADKGALAMALQSARESLESQIEQAVRSHQSASGEPLRLDLDLKGGQHRSDQGPKPLLSTVRALIDTFQQHHAVVEAGVQVTKVTAVDSDGDGTAAVNIQYDYKR